MASRFKLRSALENYDKILMRAIRECAIIFPIKMKEDAHDFLKSLLVIKNPNSSWCNDLKTI